MRLDVEQCVQQYIMNKIKPNFAEIGRRYGVDPRTVKRYYNLGLRPQMSSHNPYGGRVNLTIIEKRLKKRF